MKFKDYSEKDQEAMMDYLIAKCSEAFFDEDCEKVNPEYEVDENEWMQWVYINIK